MKRVLALLMALAMFVVIAGCGGSGSSSGGTAISVASITPLSGGQASLGSAIKNAAEMAVKDMEKDLTAAGYKLTYSPQDDEAKPEVGAQVAQRLAADKSVVGTVGTLNSGVAKLIMPVFTKEGGGLVMISPANTNPTLTQSGWANYNRVLFRDDFQGPAGARYVVATLKPKSVAVINDKSDYGKGFADQVTKTLKAAGVDVKEMGVDEGKPDYSAEATQIASMNVDVVYFGGIYNTAGPFFKQIRAKGFKGTFVGADGLDDATYIQLAGDAAEGTIFTSVYADYAQGDAKAFADKYKAQYKADPPGYAAYGYDAMKLLLTKIVEYGKKNSGKAPGRAELAKLVRETKDYKGITGTITFDANGDTPTSKVHVFAVQGGKFVSKGWAPEK